MALSILRGPAGAGKSQELRPGTLRADLTALWAALYGYERGADGRYPERTATEAALAAYLKAAVVRYASRDGLAGVVTTSSSSPEGCRAAERGRRNGWRPHGGPRRGRRASSARRAGRHAVGRVRDRGVTVVRDGSMTRTVPIELREADGDAPRLHGTIITEGSAARGGRAEVFRIGSLDWPSNGVAIRAEHLGAPETRAIPVRQPNGEIQIAARATPGLRAAYEAGRRSLSIEFRSVSEETTIAGVREIQGALLEGAALVRSPEYDGTGVEIRRSERRRWWL